MPPEPSVGDKQSARTKLNLPADKLIVIFLGQLIERKGVADLLQASGAAPRSSAGEG